MYGERFKQLRLKQSKTLTQTAANITSVASLSKWENGKGKMDFEKAILLLKRINCLPSELIFTTDSKVTRLAKNYYYSNQNADLIELGKSSLQTWRRSHNFQDLYNTVMVAAAIKSSIGPDLLSIQDKRVLVFYLSEVKNWTHDKIALFSVAAPFLSPLKNYAICSLIIENISADKARDFYIFNDVLLSLLNVVLALIQKKDIILALKLLDKFDAFSLNEEYSLFYIRKYFFRLLCRYCQTNNKNELEDFLLFISKIGMKQFLEECKADIKYCHKLYFLKN